MRGWAWACIVAAVAVLMLPTSTGTFQRSVGDLRAPTDTGVAPMVVLGHAVPAGGESCSRFALCPSWVRTSYNFSHLVRSAFTNGTGETMVIVDACGDPHVAKDLTTFDTANHLPVASLNVTSFGPGKTCRKSAWATETSLDVEWAHAFAPGAQIDLIVTTDSKDRTMYAAWNYSLAHHLGNQISNSWGGHGGCGPRLTTLLANATAAGVTVLASAGDSAAWGLGTGQAVQNPADCPSVVTVGGTTLHVGTRGAYVSESAWYASGGGYVNGRAEPSYQKAANISDPSAVLGKPDVAAVADPSTGVWVFNGDQGGWIVVGGTSVACPIWAAFVADVNSLRAHHSLPPLGSVNAYLYTHVYGVGGASANYSAELHDVTTGNNGWGAGPGWDPATGLGSFNADPLARQLGTDPLA